MVTEHPLTNRLRTSLHSLRGDWTEIGGLGRLAVIGIVLALVATLTLGFSITRSARGHLLEARAAMVSANIGGLPPFPADTDASVTDYAAFDAAVRVKILGGETVRVKVWDKAGMVVYSDAEELIGRRFSLPVHAAMAFEEGNKTHVSDLSDPAHAFDRGHGELIEYYIALSDAANETPFVVEVEQDASELNHALGRIKRDVWLSIGIGLVAIGLVMAVGVAARTREVNRRRRQAEKLLASSFTAQEEERRRVVRALHDDIGQPMYRLLYGIQGSSAKLDPADPVAIELNHLGGVVRQMDRTLRNELRMFHFELAADAGIGVALEELLDLTRMESDLDANLFLDLDYEATAVQRTELYRAAREAITNVRKHARATQVDVRLSGDQFRLTLEVVDNGTGLNTVAGLGLGLSTTRQRFRALDGDVTVERVGSSGTRFCAWLPRTDGSPQ